MKRSVLFAVIAGFAVAVELGAQATTQTPPSAATQAQAGDPQYIPPNARGSLSQAVRVGNMLYLSGQLGTDTSTKGIEPETAKALQKIKALLEANGSSMDRVVRCTVFLVDIAEWSAMNRVYGTFFPTSKPARSALAVTGLVGNGRVEIECMAVVK
jgi:2-iminobutanoate/2-iminopropanoate deaminase